MRSKIGKLAIFIVLAVFGGSMTAFTIDVSGTAPHFTGQGAFGSAADQLNIQVADAFEDALDELRNQVGGIDPKPNKFIQAWGNSGVYASHGATQRAYGGYKIWAFSIGSMVGLQIPVNPFSIMSELDGLKDKLNEEHDISLGVNPQAINAQIGINTSKFMLNNLYLGLRVGYMKLNGVIEGFSFNNMLLGVLANYQIVPPKKLAAGIIQWRGVNLGSGFIYQTTTIDYNLKLGTITENIGAVTGLPGYPLTLSLDPRLALDMKITTYTIPLEAITSVKLLYFLNIAFGLGADIAFGKSNLNISMDSDINFNGLESVYQIQQDKPGNLSASAGGTMSPSVINLKLMTGIGLSLGPVIIDIPVTWYVMNKGFNVGVTLGVVW
jgi:hypothetical protein